MLHRRSRSVEATLLDFFCDVNIIDIGVIVLFVVVVLGVRDLRARLRLPDDRFGSERKVLTNATV